MMTRPGWMFCLLIALFLCKQVEAQKHSVFLGLELGGNRDELVDSLEGKGFVLLDETNECSTMAGLFDGIGSKIEVHATPRTHTVHLVAVYFSEIQGNEIGLLMKSAQIRKQLRHKYGSWDYTHEKGLEEWSSTYARVSLGKKKLKGDTFKTLFVRWEDRSGWEALQREKQ